MSNSHPPSLSPDLDEMSEKGSSEHGEEGEGGEGSTKASSPGSSSSVPLPSMLLERKMEALTLEWNKSPDMLFTIHPTDGSFLVWHVKYLDEYIQGIFRQVQVRGDCTCSNTRADMKRNTYCTWTHTYQHYPHTRGSRILLQLDYSLSPLPLSIPFSPGVVLVPYPGGVPYRRRQLPE